MCCCNNILGALMAAVCCLYMVLMPIVAQVLCGYFPDFLCDQNGVLKFGYIASLASTYFMSVALMFKGAEIAVSKHE